MGWNNTISERTNNLPDSLVIIANQDMPFLGMSNGDAIEVKWDGEYMRCGPLSWDPEQLQEEIESGVWKIKE